MAQILGYLTLSEARQFQDYAAVCGVAVSTLANLLITRELRVRRLARKSALMSPSKPSANDSKIVAHFAGSDRKAEFSEYARMCGMKPSTTAAQLFRAELEEHWLLRSLSR